MQPERQLLTKTTVWVSDRQIASESLTLPKNSRQSIQIMKGTFKSEVVRIFRQCTGSTQFVDVGVNTGQTMVEILQSFPDLIYFGFEPNPEAYCCARQLAEANNFNVKLFPWACSDMPEPLELFAESSLDSSATAMSSIRPNTYSEIKSYKIASYPLDSILRAEAQYGFILKIDVEGTENEVLQGAHSLIRDKRPLICCEVLHAHRASEVGMNNRRKKCLQEFLAEQDYSIYAILLDPSDREKFIGTKKITSFPVDTIWSKSPHTCDYIFLPNEVPSELIF